VSGDLRGHSVGFFVEGLIKNLDSEKFEIHAFSTSPHADELTSRIRPCFRDWMPIHGISDEKAAALIHEKEIDILIDLAGHTAGNRIPVFAYKPAPLQISWLGLPMTTGAAEMDYVIGDAHALPHDHEDQFVESIWRLPDTYLSMDLAYLKSEVNRARRTPNDQITFGSFNNISKINDAVMKAWSEILNRVPSSRLYLKCKQLGSPEVQRETVNRFLAHGVQPDRLLLSAQLGSRPKHLEEYRKVDIALDTFPYPGVTTSAEALWMGVPVLSMKGNSFLSSTATSIAVNAGLIEWVAKDVDEYVAKAVAFASDSSGLSAVCDKLRATIDQSVLFDSPLFAERFGNALMSMWNQRFGA
jgi:predicted O-linked N-acetylglucosamine transferase (SPINDLY family)